MKQLLAGVCCLLALQGITQGKPRTDSILFRQFSGETSVQFENLFTVKEIFIRRLYLADWGFVCWGANEDRGYHLRTYSKTGTLLPGGFIPFGRGPGKASATLSGGLYQGLYWVHDILDERIVTERKLKKENGIDSLVQRDFLLQEQYYSVAFLNNKEILGAGIYDAKYKVARIDLASGSTNKTYGEFGEPPAGIPFNSWTDAYQSFLYANPGGTVAAIACRFADQVEFIDLATGHCRRLMGPEHFLPQYNPIYAGGRDMMERTADCRFAFVSGAVTDKYLYLVYSGELEVEGAGNLNSTGRKIYVYDWEGNPVRKITLPAAVSTIAISPDDSYLYAVNPATQAIVKARL